MPYINSDHLLNEIEELKKSPWFNRGNGSGSPVEEDEYYVRKDAVECVVDVCIKKEPAADVEPIVHAHWIRRYCDHRNDYLDVLAYPYICSWCREKSKETTKRCPECGARMDDKVKEDV